MYLMYADESGSTGTDYDNKQQPIFVLAGILVEEKKWHEINNFFNKEKVKICELLKCNEIHTSEIFNPRRKSIFRHDDWSQNLVLLENLVNLISTLDLSAMYIAIDKKDFKRSVNAIFKNTLKVDPYIYSFGMLYDNVSENLYRHHNKGIIFLDDIITIPSQLHNIYPILSKDNCTMIEEAIFVKSNCSNFIQIADVFAFYIEKYWSIKKGYKNYGEIKNNHCIKMYSILESKISLVGSEFLTKYVPFKFKEYYE